MTERMPIAIEPGMLVSHYQVVGRLGAGGMGEVYKALDTVLGRTVALKVLPLHLVRNEERTRRFVQEARSASSLNHPNIVTIYEIGQAPVVASGEGVLDADPIHYIAMELVEGVTLKHKIHDEGSNLRTLLAYIAQAAEGLAKAHAAGIVHRDLKPDNIMVSADGFVKVLDFGLAKLTVPQDPSDAHTRTMPARDETREGIILGTVAYMAPEQVQGKSADHRSDIFAIGTILYEVATRRRPFTGDSDVEVMHKILHDKPEPVADINPTVPAELRRTIRRCLAKEPERRFQSMKDVAIELAEIVEEFEQLSIASTSSGSGSGSGATLAAVRPRAGAAWKGAIAGVALLALAAIGFGLYQWRHGRAAPAGLVAFESMNIRPLTSSGRAFRTPAISPDGKYVAYVSREPTGFSVWMRQVATGSEVRIVPEQPTQLQALVFSPDGNYLYYGSSDQGSANILYSWLFAVPTIGGQPRKVLFDVDTAVAFSPDGAQIAFGRGVPAEGKNHVMVAKADGSAVRTLASFPRVLNAGRPVWSPDGTKIVVAAVDLDPAWNVAPMEIDVASGATRRIGNTRRFYVADPEFLPDGSGLLMVGADAETARQQVWLQPYPEGVAQRVTNDLSDYGGIAVTRDASVIAALKSETKTSLNLSSVDDTTPGRPMGVGVTGRLDDVAVSRTGVAVYASATGNASEIVVLDTPASAPRVLTPGGENFGPSISADGRTIVFTREGADVPPHIYAIDADGSNLRQITDGSGETDAHLSADGASLIYSGGYGNEIWFRRFDGGQATRLTERASGPGRLSPDGQFVLFLEWQTADRAAANLKLVPATGGAPVIDMPWDAGLQFQWHPDGKRVTFKRIRGGVNNLFSIPVTGGEPTPLTRFATGNFSSYDWTADGGLVLVRTATTSDVVLITDWRRKS